MFFKGFTNSGRKGAWKLRAIIEDAFRAEAVNLGCTVESPGGAFKKSLCPGCVPDQLNQTHWGYDPGIKTPHVILECSQDETH